jgi:predicted component of type VI protein secretion system
VPPFLITQRGPEIGRRYDLTSSQFTIGRGTDNDLVLGDALVSRYHAVIRQENEGVVIIDLGSTNPVLVNDVPLEAGVPRRLQHRDLIVIGQNVFSFQNPSTPPTALRPPRHTEPATIVQGAPVAPEPVPPPWPPAPAGQEESPPPAAAPRWDAPGYASSGAERASPPPPPPMAPPPPPVPPDEARTVISRPRPMGGPPRPPEGETRLPPPPPPELRPAAPDDDTPTVRPRPPHER